MRAIKVIDYLDQNNIEYEYTNGWSDAYDNIQFKVDNIEYELETATNSISFIIDTDNNIGVTTELEACSDVDELLKDCTMRVEMKKLDDISVNMFGINGYRFDHNDQDLVNLVTSFNTVECYLDNLETCFNDSVEDRDEIRSLKECYIKRKIKSKDDKML